MKIMKKLSVALAAVMCCSVMSVTAYASEANTYAVSESAVVAELDAAASTTSAAYKEAVKLAGTKYNSGLAKIIAKYNKKSAKSTVTYKKSRTKKFTAKVSKASQDVRDNVKGAKGYSVAAVGENVVVFAGMKGDYAAVIIYSNVDGDEGGMGIYADSDNYTITDISSKQKMTTPIDSSNDTSEITSADIIGIDFSDSDKASVFKFNYNKKVYTYELFDIDGVKTGYLFDSNNNMIGIYTDDSGYCTVKYSFAPKTSTLTVPDDYTEMTY